MTTLQEYLNNKYPIESRHLITEIDIKEVYEELKQKYWDWRSRKLIEKGALDLTQFTGLRKADIRNSCLTELIVNNYCLEELNVSGNPGLSLKIGFVPKKLNCCAINLKSAGFLNQISNPENLEALDISCNDIQPTDISIFSRFINLKVLKTGSRSNKVSENRNRFYGSLKAFQNLTKLEMVCIEATDVDSGLEYLPTSIARITHRLTQSGGGYNVRPVAYQQIECAPYREDAKVKTIQDELRPYAYDIEAWQLAHPELMLKVKEEKERSEETWQLAHPAQMYKEHPSLFFNPETKNKWVSALRDKITKTQEKLTETKQNEPEAIKRIKRLEMKLDNLKLIQENISNHNLIDKLQKKELIKKEDKATQTELFIEPKK